MNTLIIYITEKGGGGRSKKHLPDLKEESDDEDASSEHDLDEEEVEHDADGVVPLVLLQANEDHEAEKHDQGSETAREEGVVVLAILQQVQRYLLQRGLTLAVGTVCEGLNGRCLF